jgi:hypothetical protein
LLNLPIGWPQYQLNRGARFVVFQVGDAGKPLMVDQTK